MLLFDAPLTFREFMTDEKLPLASIFREILGALRGRHDVVLFGAQAVNAPKGDTDRADIRRLLLAFPKLRERDGRVVAGLRTAGADAATLALWREVARVKPEPDADDGY